MEGTDSDKEALSHEKEENDTEKKLVHTACPIQRRFWCTVRELCVWRNALLFRYSALPSHEVSVQVTDYDENDQSLTFPSFQWITDIPTELAKTTIRIFWMASKRITITLYFKSKNNLGTCLCQGQDCVTWDKEECEILKNAVSSFLQDGDTDTFTSSLLSIPLSFIKLTDPLTLTNPSMDPSARLTTPYQGDTAEKADTGETSSPASCLSPSLPAFGGHLTMSCDHIEPKVVLHPPTPTPSRTPPPQTEERYQFVDTPSGRKKKKQRRKTLFCTSQRHGRDPSFPLQTYKILFDQLKENIEDLRSSHQDLTISLQSQLEDLKTSTKNEIKSAFRSRDDCIDSTIIDLENKVTRLTETVGTLAKNNQSLKDQIGSLRAELKARKSSVTTTDVYTQCDQVAVSSKRLNSTENGGSSQANQQHPLTTGRLTEETSAGATNRNIMQEADPATCWYEQERHLTTRPTTDTSGTEKGTKDTNGTSQFSRKEHPPIKATPQPPSDDPLIDNAHIDVTNKGPNVQPPSESVDPHAPTPTFDADNPHEYVVPGATTAYSRTDNSLDQADSYLTAQGTRDGNNSEEIGEEDSLKVDYNVPIANRYERLTKSIHSSLQTEKHQRSEVYTQKPANDNQTRPPHDILADTQVNDRATALVIGDSVLKHLNTKRLALRAFTMFKICVPGMTTLDLERWLARQPIHNNIKALVVHIGINDCPAGPVSEEQWVVTIRACQDVFPNTQLAFSSLIPAKGRHNLNNSVLPSNRSLKSACTKCNITFIDNTDSFLATSGAPKQSMYQDLTHPSPRGTAQLASNIKSTVLNWVSHTSLHLNRPSIRLTRFSDQTFDRRDRSTDNPPHLSTESLQDHLQQYKPDSTHNIHYVNEQIPPPQQSWHHNPYLNTCRQAREQNPLYGFSKVPHPPPTERIQSHFQQHIRDSNPNTPCINEQIPPPVQSLHHYPTLPRQSRDQNLAYGGPRVFHPTPLNLSPHRMPNYSMDTDIEAPNASNNFLPIPPNQYHQTNRQPLQPQFDMNRCLQLLSMMTQQMLNMQHTNQISH